MTMESYNSVSHFVLWFTSVGFAIVMAVYVPPTLFGVFRHYLTAGSKPQK